MKVLLFILMSQEREICRGSNEEVEAKMLENDTQNLFKYTFSREIGLELRR